MQTEVSLSLPLQGHVQHGCADIETLQACDWPLMSGPASKCKPVVSTQHMLQAAECEVVGGCGGFKNACMVQHAGSTQIPSRSACTCRPGFGRTHQLLAKHVPKVLCARSQPSLFERVHQRILRGFICPILSQVILTNMPQQVACFRCIILVLTGHSTCVHVTCNNHGYALRAHNCLGSTEQGAQMQALEWLCFP